MTNLKNILTGLGITPQIGDIVSLHKGKLTVSGGKPSALKAELKRLVSSGEFNIKLKLLPDVSNFKIRLNYFNPLLAAFGLQTRLGSGKALQRGRNRVLNRYLLWMYRRLYKFRNNPKYYWRNALTLIVLSHSYLSVTMHHLDKNLYRRLTSRDIKKLIARLHNLRGRGNAVTVNKVRQGHFLSDKDLEHFIVHYRAYLPKGETYRPLGVPTLAWRINTSLWLLPLNGFLAIPEYQHGFIPGRGTLTAWRQVLLQVIPSRNIYEVDFKQFFPSINASLMAALLVHKELPRELSHFFLCLSHSYPNPKSLDDSKLPETNARHKEELDFVGLLDLKPKLGFKDPNFKMPAEWTLLTPYFKEIKAVGLDAFLTKVSSELGYPFHEIKAEIQRGDFTVLYEWYQLEQAIAESLAPQANTSPEPKIHPVLEGTQGPGTEPSYNVVPNASFIGLPQGSPLSPFLSIFVLNEAYKSISNLYPSVK